MILLRVDKNVSTSCYFACGSEWAVGGEGRGAHDIVEAPGCICIDQQRVAFHERFGQCGNTEQGVAGNRITDICQWEGYSDISVYRVDRSSLHLLCGIEDDLAVLWGVSDATVAHYAFLARRKSGAGEERCYSRRGYVRSGVEYSVAFFATVPGREELPSSQPHYPVCHCWRE